MTAPAPDLAPARAVYSDSRIDKWSLLDHRRTAHWWLGSEGTACGRDFVVDIRHAYASDPRCRECLRVLALSFAYDLAHTRPEVADQPMPVVAALAVMSA